MKNTALLKIPSYFQPFMDWRTEIEIPTGTVGDALKYLLEQYPQMKQHIFTYWGILSANILFYVNEDEIYTRQGLETPLEPGDRLILVPTASGG